MLKDTKPYLAYHGVKGMKSGVRHDRKSSGSKRISKSTHYGNTKNKNNFTPYELSDPDVSKGIPKATNRRDPNGLQYDIDNYMKKNKIHDAYKNDAEFVKSYRNANKIYSKGSKGDIEKNFNKALADIDSLRGQELEHKNIDRAYMQESYNAIHMPENNKLYNHVNKTGKFDNSLKTKSMVKKSAKELKTLRTKNDFNHEFEGALLRDLGYNDTISGRFYVHNFLGLYNSGNMIREIAKGKKV